MPELPSARRARYTGLGLPLQDVLVLTEEPSIASFFDELLVRVAWFLCKMGGGSLADAG